PAHSMLVVSPFFIHRDPARWSDPERFDPDRFLPAAVAARPRHHYLPFGLGTRNCVGRSLALTELQVMLPMLLQRFRFEGDGPGSEHPNAVLPVVGMGTLRPRGLRFRLRRAEVRPRVPASL